MGAVCASGACTVAAVQSATPDEVRAIVADMLDDASARSSLLDGGSLAGHDGKRFFIASPDGGSLLSLRSQIQFRYLASIRNSSDRNNDGAPERDLEPGFQTRRTKLIAEGSAWEKSLTYKLQTAASRSSGDFILEDAFVSYAWDGGIAATFGQFKLPFMREELIGSTVTLAVESSSVYDVFTAEYGQGVQIGWTGESTRVLAAFSDGRYSRNSDFATDRSANRVGLLGAVGQGESDYALTSRFEWKHGGGWTRFRDNAATTGEEFAFLLGAAGHVEGGDGTSSAFTSGTYFYAMWTIDATIRGDGWTLSAAAAGSHADLHGYAGSDVTNDDIGVMSEIAFRAPGSDIEPFVQHSSLMPDSDRTGGGGLRAFNTFVAGVNYHLHGHAAKFTADVSWRPDDENPLQSKRTTSGYLSDDDAHELTLRLQWQLLF